MEKQIIRAEGAPAPIGCYSQAVKVGRLVFLSGQIALDPKNNQMRNEKFADELAQVFQNIQAIIEKAGGTFANVVKYTIYLTDLSLFSQVNQYMQDKLPQPFPARVTIGVASLPREASIEIDAILEI